GMHMEPGMIENLSTALNYHQRGLLDQAARVYQALLTDDPAHADALHLLGVIALQKGDLPRSVELIGRALGFNPGAAAYHTNLAEAYRGLGQFEPAADCCRVALRLQPDFPEAANNLGLALLALGQ